MNTKKTFKEFCLILIILIAMTNLISKDACGSEQKTICIVHSYPENSPWVIDFSKAIEDNIETAKDLKIKNYFLETDTIFTENQKLNRSIEIKENVEKDKPFLLICSDEEAFHYVARNFFDTNIYVIVSGLNGDPLDYDLIHNNVFAVFEQENITPSIDFAKELMPKLRTVAILSDNTKTSLKTIDLFAKKTPPVKIIAYRLIEFFSVWKERIKRYSVEADAILINRYQGIVDEETHQKVPPEEVIKWTIENCDVPTIGCFDYEIQDGVMCGNVQSGYSIGFETAKLANSILEGKDIENLSSIIVARRNTMLNLNTAKKLNIDLPDEVLKQIDKVIE